MFQPSQYFVIAQSFALTIVIVMCFYVAGPPLMQMRMRRNALVLRSSVRTKFVKLLLAFSDAIDPPSQPARSGAPRIVGRLIGYAMIAAMVFVALIGGGVSLAQTLESSRIVMWCGGSRRLITVLICMASFDVIWTVTSMIRRRPEPVEGETQ